MKEWKPTVIRIAAHDMAEVYRGKSKCSYFSQTRAKYVYIYIYNVSMACYVNFCLWVADSNGMALMPTTREKKTASRRVVEDWKVLRQVLNIRLWNPVKSSVDVSCPPVQLHIRRLFLTFEWVIAGLFQPSEQVATSRRLVLKRWAEKALVYSLTGWCVLVKSSIKKNNKTLNGSSLGVLSGLFSNLTCLWCSKGLLSTPPPDLHVCILLLDQQINRTRFYFCPGMWVLHVLSNFSHFHVLQVHYLEGEKNM